MRHHSFRLLLIALCVTTPLAAKLDASPPIVDLPIPPAAVTYAAGRDDTRLTWWQASNADAVIIMDACNDTLIGYEDGQPGWHERQVFPQNLHSCLTLAEYREANLLGRYGPYALEPLRLWLPLTGR